jgi:hypothetical protein
MRYSFVSTAICAAVFNAASSTAQIFDYANFPLYGPAGPFLMSVPNRMITSSSADTSSYTTVATYNNVPSRNSALAEATTPSAASFTSFPSSSENVINYFTSTTTTIEIIGSTSLSTESYRTVKHDTSTVNSTTGCQSLVATELRSQSSLNTTSHRITTNPYSTSTETAPEAQQSLTRCSKSSSMPEVPQYNTTMISYTSRYSSSGSTNTVNTSEVRATGTRSSTTGGSLWELHPTLLSYGLQNPLCFSWWNIMANLFCVH